MPEEACVVDEDRPRKLRRGRGPAGETRGRIGLLAASVALTDGIDRLPFDPPKVAFLQKPLTKGGCCLVLQRDAIYWPFPALTR